MNLATGKGKSIASTVGALGAAFVVQTGPASHGAVDSVGQGTSVSRGQIVITGTKGSVVLQGNEQVKTSTYGTPNWRRINNYQDLKNAKSE